MPNYRNRSVHSSGTAASALAGAAALLLGLGALTACQSSDSRLYAGGAEASATASPTFSPTESASPRPFSLSVRHGLTALETAQRAVPRSTAYHLTHDDEGTPEWEIKVAEESGSEWDVSVSDDGKKVTGRHEDTTPDDNADKLEDFRVPIEEAVRKAAARHPDQDLHSVVTTKNKKGEDLWQVTVVEGAHAEAKQTQLEVEVKTGKVLREKQEK
ncbi:PepSY domain-containing protein [Streptomyces sp. 891-h]|uniref:PepSY domain-containing protein n=1 Tax=Streptomyces sp. 891-h TaxID=2720714 RepID=UPI001FAAE221|nr:PepSY domain-containing protein [Streptomyces sp. 891-h]UNZ16118.1 hypothetical protein HC362_02420 [Streptomyces sp. 891-h]